MNTIILLCFLVGVDVLIGVDAYIIRDFIDRTDMLNCSVSKPVFACKFNDTEKKRCISKKDMMGNFIDINMITWLKIDFFIHETYTLHSNWIKSDIQFTQYKHLIKYTPPKFGVLLMLMGKSQRLIMRSYGEEIWIRPTNKTIATKPTPTKQVEIAKGSSNKYYWLFSLLFFLCILTLYLLFRLYKKHKLVNNNIIQEDISATQIHMKPISHIYINPMYYVELKMETVL